MTAPKFFTEEDVRQMTRDAIDLLNRTTAGGQPIGGMSVLARDTKVGMTYLSRFLTGTSNPPKKLLERLGLKSVKVYEKTKES